jgi:alpha-tubulin suppressor-like RCC1 family protein
MTGRRISAAIAIALVAAFAAGGASGARSVGLKRTAPATAKLRIAGGLYHGLAVTSGGAVFAWGWNIVGQLGDGSTNSSDAPVRVRLPGGMTATAVGAGFAHSAALTSTGAVLAWGKNYNGNLGNGSTADSGVPVKVNLPAGTQATAIAVGGEHNLAVTSTGAVLAWGYGADGQLGNGGTGSSGTPVNVSLPTGTKVIAVAAGSLHSLALTSTGTLLAWGDNADGQLGNGNRKNSAVPVKVKLPAGLKVVAIAAGGYYSLAVTSTGAVLAWGYNADGELGNGTRKTSAVPVRVKLPAGTKMTAVAAGGPLEGVGQVAAGPGHSLALTSTGAVFAWGYNTDGQLGDGNRKNSAVPVKVKLPAKVSEVAAGQLHSLALTSSGAVFAWGGNNFGQLGDESYEGSDVPVRVNLP